MKNTSEYLIGTCNNCGTEVMRQMLKSPVNNFSHSKKITAIVTCLNDNCINSCGESMSDKPPTWVD